MGKSQEWRTVSEELGRYLAKNGQVLLPMVELIEQSKMAVDELLVTGGGGFIGINLLPALKNRYETIRVLDDLSAGREQDIETLGVDFQAGDIRDEVTVARAMEGVEVVVHLAAHTQVVESVQNPLANFEINARGTLNSMRAAVEKRVRRFVMASTGGAILGEKAPPVHEGMVPQPLSPWGASKLAAVGYCSAFHASYGLRRHHPGLYFAQWMPNELARRSA